MSKYPQISFTSGANIVVDYLAAGQPVGLEGAPGVGKTAFPQQLVIHLAERLGLEEMGFASFIGSTLDPTDIGGFPVVSGDRFNRIPMAVLREAAERPLLLLADELTCNSPAVQSTMLALFHEHRAGDLKLHPQTRIMAAFNPADQILGGGEITAPLVNRSGMFHFVPTVEEVRAYMAKLGDDGSTLRRLGVELSALIGAAPAIVEGLDVPPQASIDEGEQWASPRALESALRVLAGAIDHRGEVSDEYRWLVTAGRCGQRAAAAIDSILKLRDHVATVEEVLADPATAKLPANPTLQVGALAVLAQAAQSDLWAAWIYAERLNQEVLTAAWYSLKGQPSPKKSPHTAAGRKALVRVQGHIGHVLRGE